MPLNGVWLLRATPATSAATPSDALTENSTSSSSRIPKLIEEGEGNLDQYIDIQNDNEEDPQLTRIKDLLQRLPLEISSDISSSQINHAFSGYGTTIITLRDGRIFISQRNTVSRIRRLFTNPGKCEHGTRERPKRQILCRSAVCSSREVVMVAQNGSLWTAAIDDFSSGKEKDEEGENEVKWRKDDVVFVRELTQQRCMQISAGSNFFIALLAAEERKNEEEEELNEENKQQTIANDECSRCMEEMRLRLSTLMKEADRDADLSESHSDSGYLKSSARSSDEGNRTAFTLWEDSEDQLERSVGGGSQGGSDSRRLTLLALDDDRISTRVCKSESFSTLMNREENKKKKEEERKKARKGWKEKKHMTTDTVLPEMNEFPLDGKEGRRETLPAKVFVATWGGNECGQLGHGDNVVRFLPHGLSFFDSRRVCSVTAGDTHAAALTANGTVYVWGALCAQQQSITGEEGKDNGELKRQFSRSPTLFKTGQNARVLDVSACGPSLTVLTLDEDPIPKKDDTLKKVVGRIRLVCSRLEADGEDKMGEVIQWEKRRAFKTNVLLATREGGISRCCGMGKDIVCTAIRLLSGGRILVRATRKEGASTLSFWRDAVALSRLLEDLQELGKHCLQERIRSNSTSNEGKNLPKNVKNAAKSHIVPEAGKFLRRLNKAIARFSAFVAVNADYGRHHLSLPQSKASQTLYEVYNSARYRILFLRFVDAYVTARAYGSLDGLPFSVDSAERYVERLSDMYDVASTRPDSVVRKLFALPIDFLRRSNEEYIMAMTEGRDDMAAPGFASEWKNLLNETEETMKLANETAVFWRREGESVASSLHCGRRLLVWRGGSVGSHVCEGGLISVVASNAGLLSPKCTHVFVFSDLIVFGTRSTDQRFPTRLVWLSEMDTPRGYTSFFLLAETPDEKYTLEFGKKEDMNLFRRQVSFWHWALYGTVIPDERSVAAGASPTLQPDPPVSRSSEAFVFSKSGAMYEGEWRNAHPHGRGRSLHKDGTRYEGEFVDGLPHGHGVMSVPVSPSSSVPVVTDKPPSTPAVSSSFFYVPVAAPVLAPEAFDIKDDRPRDMIRGHFEKGQATGLVHIRYASGVTYHGYVEAAIPHGFGELLKPRQHYIGFFSAGKRHGYGVSGELNEHSTIRKKYLGEFVDGQKHGKGAMIDGSGAFCEGEWRMGVFKTGRVQCAPPDEGEGFALEYSGECNGWRHASGKGVLSVSLHVKISGRFNYVLVPKDGSISKRPDDADIVDAKIEMKLHHNEEDEGREGSKCNVKWQWQPLLDLFLKVELEVEKEEYESGEEEDEEHDEDSIVMTGWRRKRGQIAEKAWIGLKKSMKRRELMMESEGEKKEEEEEDEENNESYQSALRPWSAGYHVHVCCVWKEAMSIPSHPLARLANTLSDVYNHSFDIQASYGGALGAHRCVYAQAARELRQMMEGVYSVCRVLFPNLPSDPYATIPEAIPAEDIEDETDSVDSDLPDTVDDEGRGETGTPRPVKSADTDLSRLLPPFPAINFLYQHFFALLHPIVSPVYILACADKDDRYWRRILYLNAHTDVKLLSFLGVDKEIWPIELSQADDLSSTIIRITARYGFYKTAITTLQNIPCESCPLEKERILVETFVEINSCVSTHCKTEEGKSHQWSADTLLPAFIYVVIRAGIKHLGAEIRLMEDFSCRERENGPVQFMFTNLKVAYEYICKENSIA